MSSIDDRARVAADDAVKVGWGLSDGTYNPGLPLSAREQWALNVLAPRLVAFAHAEVVRALERARSEAEGWPLSPRNMADAERWSEKAGWSHAVASVCRYALPKRIRALIQEYRDE